MLMIPGPSEPEPEVLAELSLPILPHYGDKWKAIYDDTLSKMKRVFRTRKDVIIVPIPGQLAVEMAVTNLVPSGGDAFVCVNGLFSGMIVDMVNSIGAKAVPIESKLGTGPTVEQVEAVLKRHKNPEGRPLFLVHNETSTGAATDPAAIFKLCKEYGVLTVLDSISAIGGIDVRVDEWQTDYAIGYASKALGGAFGAQPVAVGKEAWAAAERNKNKIHSRFLNLNVWKEAIEENSSWGHPYPSSMPTSVIVALRKATEMALSEGLDNRYKRHADAAKQMRDGLEALKLAIFTDSRFYSNTVSVAEVGKWEKEFRKRLLSDYNIMISGGLGPLTGKIVRVGHMGSSAKPDRVALTLAAMGSVLKQVRG